MYALTETHLRNAEIPMLDHEWMWFGANRQAGDKKGGGVGFLVSNEFRERIHMEHCATARAEHQWLTIYDINGQQTHIAVVYMATESEIKEWNEEIYGCLHRDILLREKSGTVIIVGDFNCHLVELDGEDKRADNLRDLVEHHNLEILNMNDNCAGKVTWNSGIHQSTIDYALMKPNCKSPVSLSVSMHIDEDGEMSCGSDHNRIKINLRWKGRQRKNRKRYVRKKSGAWRIRNEEKLETFAQERR